MNDVATLKSIALTLEKEPLASQQVLAKNSGMSVGLMNAVLKRFVERGWIMITNVNLRKLSYAVTPEGIAELTERSRKFAKRTFAIANEYNDTLCQKVREAKKDGKNTVVLYGNSYVKFLLSYVCQTLNVTFLEKEVDEPITVNALCVVGELSDESDIERLMEQGCVTLLDLVKE